MPIGPGSGTTFPVCVKHSMPGDVAYSASLGKLCRPAFLAAVPAKARASLFTHHSGLIANLVYFKNPKIVARLGCPVGGDEVCFGHTVTIRRKACDIKPMHAAIHIAMLWASYVGQPHFLHHCHCSCNSESASGWKCCKAL